MSALRLRIEWAILLVLAIAGALLSQSSALTGRIDNQLLDRALAFVRPPLADDIVIVAIDDQSLAQVGPWTWSRDKHGQLVDRLTADGARVVMLDVLFIEPSQPDQDNALAAAIRRNGSVFLPHSFTARANAIGGDDPLFPLPQLVEASAGIGHVVARPDSDGVLRRFDLAYQTDEGRFPHAAVTLVEALGERENSAWPLSALIAFHPEAAFSHEPASNVLSGSTIDGFFEGKIVLIGATAPGLGDRYSVATGSVNLMTGVGTQANLINALRTNAIVTPVGPAVQTVTAILLLLGLFLAFWRLPPRYVLICAGVIGATMLLASLALLGFWHLWFAPGSILLAIALSYPLWSWRRLSHVSRYLDREAARLTAKDNAPVAGLGVDYVTRQVEQLRRLISSVRGSLSFLSEVIEAAPDAIVVLDRNRRVQMLNERALELFPGWRPDDTGSFADLVARAGASQAADGNELASANGRIFLIARADIAQESDAAGTGEIIALRDVTDLRRLDDERQQMLEFLSHDMRTPQVAIVGLTERAKQLGGERDIAERIKAQAQRTLKLADDFVQLARLNSPSLAIADSDVAALVAEACDRAYSMASSRHIVIAQAIPQEPCFAMVDASLIARMLDNLIGNAIKYSGPGSRIDVSLSGAEDSPIVIEVTDDGPGLSPERLANPFARFGAHSSHAGPSAGLGLALVKKVVDLHKGSIALRSKTGKGTRFTVTLPNGQPNGQPNAVQNGGA